MIKEYEKNAKLCFENKQYQGCLKACFTAMSINPELQWIYDLSGYCYMNLQMYSQSRGCFNTSKDLETDENKIKNYERLIKLCYEKENIDKHNNNAR